MKLFLTASCIVFLFYYSVAQEITEPVACTYPKTYIEYGSIDFTTTQYDFRLLVDGSGNPNRIFYGTNSSVKDVNYKAQYKVINGVNTAVDEACNGMTPTNCTLDATTLTYLVYYPVIKGTSTDLRNCKIPAIILFHAGGFSDCKETNPSDHGIYLVAEEFAKRGYVAFVAEYRTGRWIAPSKWYTILSHSAAISC